MWMRFPPGVESISVEQQTFKPEFEKDGDQFARFPEHFVPKVINANMGFTVVSAPEGAPEDLPPTAQTSVIADMGIEVERLRQDNLQLQTALGALDEDNKNLKRQLATIEGELKRRDEAEAKDKTDTRTSAASEKK